jgi:AAA+ ATPase superfamily predicted ATPase
MAARMPFYNRKRELAELDDFLKSRRSELVVIYGRRGVGKSALLAEALISKPHLYYQATTRAMNQQLEDMTSALRVFAPEAVVGAALASLDAWLEAITRIARSRSDPVIVVIDELPYVAEADPATPTVLQRWWDGLRRQRIANVKMFLLGSLVGWMEAQALAARGPLHNRRTGQLMIAPMDYHDSALFYDRYEAEQRVQAFAIWGGMPSYLEEVDPELPLWDNVRDRILRRGARLAEEPRWLAFSDLRTDAVYASLLRAIAHGERRPGKIARAIGRERADSIAFHLERLIEMGLVRRVAPVNLQGTTTPHRQSLYILADHYVAFWYRFVDPLLHLLALRRYDEAVHIIREDFDRYVSEGVFEDLCRQFLWQAMGARRLPEPLTFESVGAWWVARTDVQDEVDVVAMNGGRAVLVGECKWSRQPAGVRELDGLSAALRRAGDDLRPIDRPWRAVFSRAGFTKDLRELAGDPEERVLLYSPSDLYG